MNSDFDLIKKKYPWGYEKFLHYYTKSSINHFRNYPDMIEYFNDHIKPCHCDFEKFFLTYDIFLISIIYQKLQNYLFINTKENMKKYKIYEKYQKQAIQEAFEILEVKK